MAKAYLIAIYREIKDADALGAHAKLAGRVVVVRDIRIVEAAE